MANPRESVNLKPEPLIVSRTFPASRETVFAAWSSAEHVKRWFSPETYSNPEAEVDFRPGGVFNVCMRSLEGEDFWSHGTFLEISPPERLVLSIDAEFGGVKRFTAHTAVTFEVEGAGTRMTVRQSYEFHDPAFIGAAKGAPDGCCRARWFTVSSRLGAATPRRPRRSIARSPTRKQRGVGSGAVMALSGWSTRWT
jgi:uncharacterized protein YndB with AHSA1/START domain